MNVTFPTYNLQEFDRVLKSTEAAVDNAVNSPPVEVVPVKSKAGGFVMKRQLVGAVVGAVSNKKEAGG